MPHLTEKQKRDGWVIETQIDLLRGQIEVAVPPPRRAYRKKKKAKTSNRPSV